MESWVIVVSYGLILGTLIAFLYYFTVKNAEEKKPFVWQFLIGAGGWTLALVLRIIPLQLLQTSSIAILGGDLSNNASVQTYASNFLVQIWGPILAGVFEEGMRYFIYKGYRPLHKDHKKSPFIYGLGWTSAEIVVIAILPIAFSHNLTWISGLISLFERLVASTFHIAMAFIVFYAIFEPKGRRKSLILAMGLHFLLDFLIVLWPVIFSNLDSLAYALTIEAGFFILTCGIVVFTVKYWIPRGERIYKEILQIEEDISNHKTTKDEIEIDTSSL
ncbi:MAG: hypothetical protein ACTSVU_06970 [Promethearchaeota archaeon]